LKRGVLMNKKPYDDHITTEIVGALARSMAVKPGVTSADVCRSIGTQVEKQFSISDIAIRLEWLTLESVVTKIVVGEIGYYALNLGQKGVVPSTLLDTDVQSYCGIA
jgi:hypothetical protein